MLAMLGMLVVLAALAVEFIITLIITLLRIAYDIVRGVLWLLTFPIHRGEPRKEVTHHAR